MIVRSTDTQTAPRAPGRARGRINIVAAAFALLLSTPSGAQEVQEVTVSGGHVVPASPLRDVTTGQCDAREISFIIERDLSRDRSGPKKISVVVDQASRDLTGTDLGRDLQQPDLVMRYFIFCRHDGFGLTGFGFNAGASPSPSGVRFIASMDRTGVLNSYTGLIPEAANIVATALD